MNPRDGILFPIHQPVFKTYTELKNHRKASVKSCENMKDQKKILNFPESLSKKPSPLMISSHQFSNCSTKTELDLYRKKINKEYTKTDLSYISAEDRLIEREKKYNLTPTGGKTYQEIKQKIRKEDCDYFVNVFSNEKLGIHGRELPKFHNNLDLFSKQDWPEFAEDWEWGKRNFLCKAKAGISEDPGRVRFTPENYRTKSQFLRMRDKNIGADVKSKVIEDEKIGFFRKKNRKKFAFKGIDSVRAVRSRGFL